jgi:exodeoxyribonuclease VII large subunit
MNLEIDTPIYTVSQLNQEIRSFLEESVAPLWINGEISNFANPSSGHWYFTLKDASAGLKCAFFQPRMRGIKFLPANGMHILCHGRVSLYEARGEYQFILDHIEPAGDGLLQRAFNQLKEKLFQEGLFEEAHKKRLPDFPSQLGIITSPTGAAVHDILHVLKKRFPLLPIILYPTSVQGALAKDEITEAIRIANQRKECDVLILGRGGGSLEDLWPFNEEKVARAIYESEIPIVSAVGHEIDVTISDFVADVRAPTPSAAATLVCPDQTHLIQQITHLYQRLKNRHPEQLIQENIQNLDRLEQSLFRSLEVLYSQKEQQLDSLIRSLNAMNPLSVLDRGYAFLKISDSNQLITSIHQVNEKDNIIAKLKDGELNCKVEKINGLITPKNY